MPTVVKSDFAAVLPEIKEKIDKAAFLAIDSEFTGLSLGPETRSSLFDSAEARYLKARQIVKKIAISQFGLSAYISLNAHKYEVFTYNFYLFPAAVGNYDCRFVLQASSIQFLARHGFDFNKMFHEGIPYLNGEQERLLQNYFLRNVAVGGDAEVLHRNLVRKYCSRIARWLVQARDGDVFTYDKTADAEQMPNCIIHERLISRIDNIWPLPSSEESLVVEKVSADQRKRLEEENPPSRNPASHVQDYLGFTQVIRHITEKKKIVVGHNLYLDLLLVYDKFIDHLPKSYAEYKSSMNRLLPEIYDTKHMILSSKKMLGLEVGSTSLSGLYTQIASETNLALFAPYIVNNSDVSIESQQIHEAGFDSYMCGYVFLRLAHLITLKSSTGNMAVHQIPFYDYSQHLVQYKNRINLIRASLNHINLGGSDPLSARPDQLYVKSSQNINTDEIALLFSSYGAVDINPLGDKQAIVAVGNFTSSRRILQAFKGHEKYRVVKYSFWRHSPLISAASWTGALLTAGVCTLVLFKTLRKRVII